jgi:hypothetical protein
MGAPIPCIHRPSVLITTIGPTSSEKIIKVCFHCEQRCHFVLQYPDRCQRQTPPNRNCYNCEEKGHFTNVCPYPCSRPPLPPSTKTTPNHKRGSTSVKATTSWFNYGHVGHFANRCLDLRQLSTPTQGNQNMARTPVYKKCYNCGQKSHFTNVCPNQWYCPDVTKVATSTPNRQVNSTMSTIHHQFQQRLRPTEEQGYAAPQHQVIKPTSNFLTPIAGN